MTKGTKTDPGLPKFDQLILNEKLLVPRKTLWLGLGPAPDLAGLDGFNRLYWFNHRRLLYLPA
jgi:hypothetical protein